MAAAANFGGFNTLMRGYQDYLAMADAQTRTTFTRDCLTYKPVLGVPPFAQGPGYIAVFAAIYEILRKLNHMHLVGRFYGTQEELVGTSCILNAFTGDAVGIARTAYCVCLLLQYLLQSCSRGGGGGGLLNYEANKKIASVIYIGERIFFLFMKCL